MTKVAYSITFDLYDELLLLTNATDEPRLYFRVSSRSYKPVKLEDVLELVPHDPLEFSEFYALAIVDK